MNFRSLLKFWIRRDPLRYQLLHSDMVSAQMRVTVEQYLWRSIRLALLIGMLFAFAGYLFGDTLSITLVQRDVGIYNVFNIPFPELFNIEIVGRYVRVLSIFVAFISGAYCSYAFFLKVPGIQKRNRSTKINLTLHNAVAYMYAMRRGGAELMTIFRSISDHANIYGEVALEFRQIVRDADFFGYDVVSAIRHLTETTPSAKLKDFMEDLLSVIESGGNMSEFLSGRVRLYQDEARFEQSQFLKFLSIVAESYVTLFVAGPLFLIIIMVVMGMIGNTAVMQMTMVIYAVLPIGSFIFVLVVDMISLKVEKTERYQRAKWLHEYWDVSITKHDGEEENFRQLRLYDRVQKFILLIRHPFDHFVSNSRHTFYITVPVAIGYAAATILSTPAYTDVELFIDIIDDHLIIALLIVLLPYALFYEVWSRKVNGIQALIPDFLERMASINQVGLTISHAIAVMVNTNLGLLSYEIRRIKRDMDWGANFTEALMRFEERISTPAISRTVTLITKASEMSGQISEVLSIASSDAKMSEALKKERKAEMFIYTMIVYLSFFVFLFVVAVLTTQFLPVLGNVSLNGGGTPGGAGMLTSIGMVPLTTFKRLLYHSCLVQALFSGLIAGQMGEESVGSGVKHSCAMLLISVVVFNFII